MDLGENRSSELLWWPGAKVCHEPTDGLDSLAAFEGFVDQPVSVMADVDVEIVKVFEDGPAALFDGGGELGEEQSAHGGILVARIRAFQVTVRFLESEQEAGRAGLVNPLPDPLEADQ